MEIAPTLSAPLSASTKCSRWWYHGKPWLVRRLVEAFGARFVILVILVYGVNQGIGEGWAFFATQYLLTDDPVGLDAVHYAAAEGVTNVPWQIKSMYGILSDTLPIQGLHRAPYIVIAGVAGTVSWGFLLVVSSALGLILLLLVLGNYSMASPDVIIDASVATLSRERPQYASDLQTLCWASFGMGKILSSATAGHLYDAIGSHGLLGICSVTAAVLIPTARFVPEKPTRTPRTLTDCRPLYEAVRDKPLVKLACILILCSLATGLLAAFKPTAVPYIVVPIAIIVCGSIYRLERDISTDLALASVYIFLSGAIQPQTNVMYLWFKDTEENCDAEAVEKYGKRPCFDATFYSTMITVSYVFFVLGTILYNRYFAYWSYRSIWTTTQVLLVFVNLLDLIWIKRWNRTSLGIPDEYFFLGEELLGPLVQRLNTMPMFVLSAKLCPEHMEATLFAINMGLSNFGVIVGSYVGNGLLEILGGVEGPDFDNLDTLVVLRSLGRFLPILLIPFLVPKGSPQERRDSDDDEIDGDDDDAAVDKINEEDDRAGLLAGSTIEMVSQEHIDIPFQCSAT